MSNMALFYCKECGKQISDKAKTCPNCGAPVELMNEETESYPEIQRQDPYVQEVEPLGYSAPTPGFLNQKNLKKQPFYKQKWFWIAVAVVLFIGIVGGSKKKEEDLGPEDGIEIGYDYYQFSGKNYTDVEKQLKSRGFTNITTEPVADLIVGILSKENEVSEVSIGGKTSFKKKQRVKADESIVIRYHTYPSDGEDAVSKAINEIDDKLGTKKSNSGAKTIGINETFGNSTISGMVTEVNLDYKDYNSYLVTVPKGYKAILVVYKLTNISKASNYVSVGDFNCYADNVLIAPDLFGGTDYNANIDPGRAAVLGGCYIIPENTQSIEIQYSPIGEKADKTIIKIK